MKRVWITVLLFGFVIFTLCGCGSDTQDVWQEETKQQVVADTDTENKQEIRYHEDGRIILTYSTMTLEKDANKAIKAFNAQSEEYYIEVQDFGKGTDLTTGYQEYDLALVNGTGGDILQADGDSYKKYARLGVYEDLYPYMEKDTEFNKADYWENVLKACEIDGKLYMVPVNFTVNAVFGKASLWEENETLNPDETLELLNGLEEGVELFENMTREEFIEYMMDYSEDNYVDWLSGECYFDSEQFKDILKIAQSLPGEIEPEENEEHVSAKLRSGEVLLYEQEIKDIFDVQAVWAYIGEEMVMVNNPGSTEPGYMMNAHSQYTYAINADSINKEGAWEFIKFVLSEDYQKGPWKGSNSNWFIPLNKGAFEKQMEEWQTPIYEIDENGEKVERPVRLFLSNDNEIYFDIYHPTDKEVEVFRKVIENVTTVNASDYVLKNIIMEEAGPYFDGQKSVDEVAEIIQGRISIYINENK